LMHGANMNIVCSVCVEQYSFVWTVSRLCRYTIGYVIGVYETQVVTLVVCLIPAPARTESGSQRTVISRIKHLQFMYCT